MALTQQILNDVVNYLEKQGLTHDRHSELKHKFPQLHFTLCSIDDIHVGKPAYSSDGFSLFLVDSNSHCTTLTSCLESASGLVIAEEYGF
ncbi:DUF6129 family protein [Agaribacterium sp. ZY112]|uniref:DUF6129 family protein n=1 Tax=Agaribacterium sp. ZY112 TaxID=3233574 RepID=UPI003526722F